MRRNAITSAVQEENDEINLTPMLDVVFIMLIFFIVTANFIKEPGLEINRPDSDTAETQENAAILIAVGPTGEVWMDGRKGINWLEKKLFRPWQWAKVLRGKTLLRN